MQLHSYRSHERNNTVLEMKAYYSHYVELGLETRSVFIFINVELGLQIIVD